MIAYIKEIFPCGYVCEISMEYNSLFNTPLMSADGICPLHGKKCVGTQEKKEWKK